MVALLLLIQGDSGMQATQKRERVKGDGEEKTRNKVCIYCGAVLDGCARHTEEDTNLALPANGHMYSKWSM